MLLRLCLLASFAAAVLPESAVAQSNSAVPIEYANQQVSRTSLLTAGSAASVPAPATAFEFLTMNVFESTVGSLSKIIMTPAFQGKVEIQLEDFGGISVSKNLDKLQRNATLINLQLEALSAAGWELVHVYSLGTLTTRYIFRKAKQ